MRVPADLYTKSTRTFDASLIELDYPNDHLKRLVTKAGTIKFENVCFGISVALRGWHVGLKPEQKDRYGLWFSRLRLGEIDLKSEKFFATTKAKHESSN